MTRQLAFYRDLPGILRTVAFGTRSQAFRAASPEPSCCLNWSVFRSKILSIGTPDTWIGRARFHVSGWVKRQFGKTGRVSMEEAMTLATKLISMVEHGEEPV